MKGRWRKGWYGGDGNELKQSGKGGKREEI